MNIINIGILAHVDAGKTTLTESLLYASGAISEPGSVEKGTTRTDTMLLERQREIMRLVGKSSHVLNEECEAFKQQMATETEANDKVEGETCDS